MAGKPPESRRWWCGKRAGLWRAGTRELIFTRRDTLSVHVLLSRHTPRVVCRPALHVMTLLNLWTRCCTILRLQQARVISVDGGGGDGAPGEWSWRTVVYGRELSLDLCVTNLRQFSVCLSVSLSLCVSVFGRACLCLKYSKDWMLDSPNGPNATILEYWSFWVQWKDQWSFENQFLS